MIKLKNYGLGPRALHDKYGRLHTIGIGEEIEIDISDAVAKSIRASQRKDDTLRIATNRKPRGEGEEPGPEDAALDVLARAHEMSQTELLTEARRVLDVNHMPPRPSRGDIIRRLAEVVDGENVDHPNRFEPEEPAPPAPPEPGEEHPLAKRQREAIAAQSAKPEADGEGDDENGDGEEETEE